MLYINVLLIPFSSSLLSGLAPESHLKSSSAILVANCWIRLTIYFWLLWMRKYGKMYGNQELHNWFLCTIVCWRVSSSGVWPIRMCIFAYFWANILFNSVILASNGRRIVLQSQMRSFSSYASKSFSFIAYVLRIWNDQMIKKYIEINFFDVCFNVHFWDVVSSWKSPVIGMPRWSTLVLLLRFILSRKGFYSLIFSSIAYFYFYTIQCSIRLQWYKLNGSWPIHIIVT